MAALVLAPRRIQGQGDVPHQYWLFGDNLQNGEVKVHSLKIILSVSSAFSSSFLLISKYAFLKSRIEP